MEQLLRGQEVFAVGELPTDGQRLWEPRENSPVFFFPIRHHSPACGFHLRQVMESYRPDCILIEGPNPDKPEKILQFLHISSTIKKNVGGCVHVTYR